jgi:creatinine amidohydrolase
MNKDFRYEKLSWPEIREAAKENKVLLIPVATLEDHGHHLPIDTDVVIAKEICERTAAAIPDRVLLLPTIEHGYSPHHMDFPGPITIGWSTFIEYLLNITKSLAAHGFNKILFLNGHGSNAPFVDIAARLTIIEHPHTHCGAISWWELTAVQKTAQDIRDSEWPGGTSHACELETSIYLAIDPDRVQMAKARKDIMPDQTTHFWEDLIPPRAPQPEYKSQVHMMEYWSVQSQTGVQGDPTQATAEKGQELLNSAVTELIEIIIEFSSRPIRSRVNHH